MKVLEEWLLEARSEDPIGEGIRADLKKAGYKRSQISVTKSSGRTSCMYTVSIKDVTIPMEKIEKIVQKYEEFDRDVRTGEILSGGNTFVRVEYDYNSISAAQRYFEKPMKEVIAKGTKNLGEWIPVGKDYKVAWFDSRSASNPENEYALMYKGKLIQRTDKKFIKELWRVFLAAGVKK